MATATPIDTPDVESVGAVDDPPELESAGGVESLGVWTALPSAVACAFACAELRSENRPPATMTMPSTTARATAVTRLIATAAATDTPPLDVFASGVFAASPVPLPPLFNDVPFANERSCETWSLTPFDACPVESEGAAAPDASCGAPAADAFAVAEVSEDPFAEIVTEPTAVTSRESRASAMWLAMVSASETPIAAVLPCAEPSALVLAEAVWSALALNAPLMSSGAPTPTVASVVMFERAIATDGTIATLPPAAPVLACVVM